MSVILGSSVIGGFIPEISGVFIVVIATVQTIYGFGQKSGNAMRKSAEYLQLFDDAEKYSDSELKNSVKNSGKNRWSIFGHHLKILRFLKTQIKMGVSIEHTREVAHKIQIDAISLWLGISRLLKSMPEVFRVRRTHFICGELLELSGQ
ncbi:hypothetical protein [Escherichia coli]|uniref:hypothetical protein n=1 Tax=Escherichia coli TaxID=562 RepID=UPI002FCCC118